MTTDYYNAETEQYEFTDTPFVEIRIQPKGHRLANMDQQGEYGPDVVFHCTCECSVAFRGEGHFGLVQIAKEYGDHKEEIPHIEHEAV